MKPASQPATAIGMRVVICGEVEKYLLILCVWIPDEWEQQTRKYVFDLDLFLIIGILLYFTPY